jgi:hypothetical protein
MTQKTPLATPLATAWSIEVILGYAQDGKLQIPVFQRSFRWSGPDILKLFDSLYRGYPIGNLLVWETDPPPRAASKFGPLRFEPSDRDSLLIIDGQQRITSLVATFLGGGEEDRRFQIYFDLEEEEFKRPSQGDRPKPTWLPMTEVSDTVRFLEWLQSANLPGDLVRNANVVVRALRDYKVPVYVVSGGPAQQELIREIFRRLNTTGKALKEAEIFNALHGGKRTKSLRDISESLSSLEFGLLNENWLAKALAATLGLDRSERLSDIFDKLSLKKQKDALRKVEVALKSTVKFLRDDARIVHWSLLPYKFPIIVLAAFFARFPRADRDARSNLRVWLWEGARSGQHAINSRPIIRAALDLIKRADSARSASARLRESTATDGQEFELRPHNSRNAATKVVCCVLADLGPRHLITGLPLDLEELLESERPFPQVVVRSSAGSETRVLHPLLSRGAISNARRLVELLTRGDIEDGVLSSHVIGRKAVDHLEQGDQDGFVQARLEDLNSAVQSFLARMCAQPQPLPSWVEKLA